MKKSLALIMLVIICLSCSLLSACSPGIEPQEIILGFDRSEAYFTGTKELEPIEGALPALGDIFEEANVKITANEAVKMKLTATFSDDAIENLMMSINGGAAVSFTSGIVLYESAVEEDQAQINIKIFLAANADSQSSAGKQLAFSFELTYYQD